VALSVPFDAVLTSALELDAWVAAGWLAAAELVFLLLELPQAEISADTASMGMSTFIVCRI
jgi:hypothetical protein